MDELLKIQEEALAKIAACADAKELNDLRVFYLGKKGPIQAAMKSMKTMASEERKTFGQVSNKTKQEIGQAIEEKKAYLEEKALNERLLAEDIDISLPGNRLPVGSVHPLTRVKEDLEELFLGMGYKVAEGPEVESDHFNFELMNLPKGHPARDMQDTFYIDENRVKVLSRLSALVRHTVVTMMMPLIHISLCSVKDLLSIRISLWVI